jgi:hypothetical protein
MTQKLIGYMEGRPVYTESGNTPCHDRMIRNAYTVGYLQATCRIASDNLKWILHNQGILPATREQLQRIIAELEKSQVEADRFVSEEGPAPEAPAQPRTTASEDTRS